jgi:replicative DNA helicase
MNSTDDSDASERMLPSSREIEMVVLGAMLLGPQTIGSLVVARLTDKHFEHAAHQIIFCQMTALLRENGAVDLLTLTQRLKDKELLEAVGGPAYLSDLISVVPPNAPIEHYVGKIADRHQL